MNINLGWVALRMFIECRGTEYYGIWHKDTQHTSKMLHSVLSIMAFLKKCAQFVANKSLKIKKVSWRYTSLIYASKRDLDRGAL